MGDPRKILVIVVEIIGLAICAVSFPVPTANAPPIFEIPQIVVQVRVIDLQKRRIS